MLRDRLLAFLHVRRDSPARSDSRARSHAHGHPTLRAGLHLLLIGIAALAALLTARLVADPEPPRVAAIPAAPLSGVRAIASTGEAFLRPGVSHETTESPLRASLPTPEIVQLRPTGDSDDTTLTGGVVAAAASAEDAGYEVRPLAERIAPSVPNVIYTVREGDTLGAIAETYGTTVDNILLNNAEVGIGGWIAVGEQILVPFDTGILYKVVQGETLASIIDDYLEVTIEDVIAYRPNNLAEAGDIRPGDYILLPGAEPKPPPQMSPGGWVITPPPPVSPGRFGLPLAAWSFVSDTFGTYRGPGRIHTGIDLALGGATAASSVYAACDGWVSRTEWLTYSYGYYVIVDCGDGWETLYSHFREIVVSWGQSVKKGQTVLGISGSTGFSTGEHLHFEIRYNGQFLDPEDYLDFY